MFDALEFHQVSDFLDHLDKQNTEEEVKAACEGVITDDYIDKREGFDALAALVFIEQAQTDALTEVYRFELSHELKDIARDAANQLMRDDENGLYEYMDEHDELNHYLAYLDDLIENILE